MRQHLCSPTPSSDGVLYVLLLVCASQDHFYHKEITKILEHKKHIWKHLQQAEASSHGSEGLLAHMLTLLSEGLTTFNISIHLWNSNYMKKYERKLIVQI